MPLIRFVDAQISILKVLASYITSCPSLHAFQFFFFPSGINTFCSANLYIHTQCFQVCLSRKIRAVIDRLSYSQYVGRQQSGL